MQASIFVSTGTLVPASPFLDNVPMAFKWPLYIPHRLGAGPSPDRFFADAAYGPLKNLKHCWVEPLSKLGLDARERSVAAAKAKLRLLIAQRPDAPVILVGQSQGGLIVAELALDKEFSGKIAAVIFVGVPFRGSAATQSKTLGWATCFPGVDSMQPGHPSLKQLCSRIKRSWPKHIMALVVGSPEDELVSLKSAFGVEFPKGVEVKRFWLASEAPDALDIDMEHLAADTRIGTNHIWMCRRPSWLKLIQEIRMNFSSSGEEVVPVVQAA